MCEAISVTRKGVSHVQKCNVGLKHIFSGLPDGEWCSPVIKLFFFFFIKHLIVINTWDYIKFY